MYKLLKTFSVDQVKQQTHSSPSTSQASSANFDGVSEEDMKSLFDSDGLWNDEADDDLLYQACDNVEKLSASQEEQRRNEEKKTCTWQIKKLRI